LTGFATGSTAHSMGLAASPLSDHLYMQFHRFQFLFSCYTDYMNIINIVK